MKVQRIVLFTALLLLARATSARGRRDQPIHAIPVYRTQAYVGYTYIRFNQGPGAHLSRNGFEYSLAYLLTTHLSFEGTMLVGYGGQYGDPSRLVFAGGGPRIRWWSNKGVQYSVHAAFGASHYVPQTARGKQGAFAYEVGGAVDFKSRNPRLTYRAQFDLVDTRYFQDVQLSPKISAGIVFRF